MIKKMKIIALLSLLLLAASLGLGDFSLLTMYYSLLVILVLVVVIHRRIPHYAGGVFVAGCLVTMLGLSSCFFSVARIPSAVTASGSETRM